MKGYASLCFLVFVMVGRRVAWYYYKTKSNGMSVELSHQFIAPSLREDTHKKSDFLSGWTTKGVGRVNPPDH